MSAPRLALVIHPDRDTAAVVAADLASEGFRPVPCHGAEDGRRLVSVEPDVALASVEVLATGDGAWLRSWRSDDATRAIPLVALADGTDQRRRALRLKVPNVVQLPAEAEDLVLATRAALEDEPEPAADDGEDGAPGSAESPATLQGDVDHLPVADLLSMVETHRRSGRLHFRGEGPDGTALQARLRYRDGELEEASLLDREGDGAGEDDQDDVLATLLALRSGSFVAHLGNGAGLSGAAGSEAADGTMPGEETGDGGASGGTAAAEAQPGGAASAGGDFRQMVHTALTAVNVATSVAGSEADPRRVAEVFRARRRELAAGHRSLEAFEVTGSGAVALRNGSSLPEDPEALAAAISLWLASVADELERTSAGRFSRRNLELAFVPLRDELEAQGLGALLAGGAS